MNESHDSFAQNKGLQLHFLPAVKELVMDYDPEKLLRIVSNLLSNAVKYTPEGGHVYFHLNKKTDSQHAYLNIRLQDTGNGIAPKDLPNIFDRFYQVDNSTTREGEGTGIGLALTKQLIKLMGGKIEVESEVGKGSVFYIDLPITNQARTDQQHKEAAIGQKTIIQSLGAHTAVEIGGTAPVEGSSKPQLLIVEDNPDVQQYLIACLQDHYQIDLAKNGQEGIDKAVEQIPDLIVSDVMMPEKDGYELTGTLKQDERTDHIPIVLLTAKADLDSKISGLEKGADAYLAKPFEKKELLARLEKLLELRQKLQARYAQFAPVEEVVEIKDPFLQKVYTLVEEQLSNPELDMNKMSRSLGMSRSQVFRKNEGTYRKIAHCLHPLCPPAKRQTTSFLYRSHHFRSGL